LEVLVAVAEHTVIREVAVAVAVTLAGVVLGKIITIQQEVEVVHFLRVQLI
jgi:uncharacterized membrane protein YjfL (UPF0719 family)